MDADRADALLAAFQRACETVVVGGDSNLSQTTKERALLRNALRARLLAKRTQPGTGPAGPMRRARAIIADMLRVIVSGRRASIGAIHNTYCPQVPAYRVDEWRNALVDLDEPADTQASVPIPGIDSERDIERWAVEQFPQGTAAESFGSPAQGEAPAPRACTEKEHHFHGPATVCACGTVRRPAVLGEFEPFRCPV